MASSVGINAVQDMGDLKSGFEEVDGVRLGYLIIKGKQMFALSQVFTDLLKNIPRTTVHKRMDHLNVKKHHCDLEELRKLKAINSVAFHAAKCTLISREDVEALYISCKTERVLKSKRKNQSPRLPAVEVQAERAEPQSSFWKQRNIWLGLNEPAPSLPIKQKAAESPGRCALPRAPHLPHFLCKYSDRVYPEVPRPPSKVLLTYENAAITSNYVAFHPSPPFFRSVACSRRPVGCKAAVANQPKLCLSPDLQRSHRRRPREGSRGCPRGLLLLPEVHALKAVPGGLETLRLQEACAAQLLLPATPGPYSSESESSSYSDHAERDSDFGSSLSSSSNSASSAEESPSDSSNSDEESSSDSSSASSQASLESIRFRRTCFSSLAGKPPLVSQANDLYHLSSASAGPGVSRAPEARTALCDIKTESKDRPATTCSTVRTGTPFIEVRNDRTTGITSLHSAVPSCGKRNDSTMYRVTEGASSPRPKKTAFTLQSTPTEARERLQATVTHCADSRATTSRVPKKDSSSSAPPGNGPKNSCFKVSSNSHPFPTIVDIVTAPANSYPDVPCQLHVKIKVEDISANADYEREGTIPKVKHECSVTNESFYNGLTDRKTMGPAVRVNGDFTCTKTKNTTLNLSTSHPEPSILGPLKPEDGEYKFGARVRKNYRKLVFGKGPVSMALSCTQNLSSSLEPILPDKAEVCEETQDEFTVTSKRRRLAINLTAVAKRPFNFMANFPCPPSLIIGNDGDLLPAYSLNTAHDAHTPNRVHPIWKWQLGSSPVPLPPSHKFRKL
ncbi:SKI/DACH domain-containing protein 1 [Lissotriton helveticus]